MWKLLLVQMRNLREFSKNFKTTCKFKLLSLNFHSFHLVIYLQTWSRIFQCLGLILLCVVLYFLLFHSENLFDKSVMCHLLSQHVIVKKNIIFILNWMKYWFFTSPEGASDGETVNQFFLCGLKKKIFIWTRTLCDYFSLP